MNDQRIKVLLVEDEPAYAELHTCMLTGGTVSPFMLTHAPRFGVAEEQLQHEKFDVILLDLTLPDHMGLNTYLDMRALAVSVPIVVLTGCDDDQLATQAVRNGAQDYLIKGQIDGRLLTRVIRYAIERKRAEEHLKQQEEFFRLITENVSDLIAVIHPDGRRIYSSPSYRELLGDPERLKGTDSFREIHPADRERVAQVFGLTLATGIGQRIEYRLLSKDGGVRYLESQGNVIRDECGKPSKLVLVSRDVTERKEAVEVLRHALSDLKQSNEELKAMQMQLIQSERLEAVSTFAAGVAHEVKNPLQTIVLGLDYLTHHVAHTDETAGMVLADMEQAVHRADNVIRGLVEFSSHRRIEVREEDINAIVEQALPAVQTELINHRIHLTKDLARGLPRLRLDPRTMKHVFINVFASAIRSLPEGAALNVRTGLQAVVKGQADGPRLPAHFKAGEPIVVAEVEGAGFQAAPPDGAPLDADAGHTEEESDTHRLGLTVLRKIIELHGGVIDVMSHGLAGSRFTIVFRAPQPQAA